MVVDQYSRFVWVEGTSNKSTVSVIEALEKFTARYGKIKHMDSDRDEEGKIRSDAGTELLSQDFQDWCTSNQVNFSTAAPDKQYQNTYCERHYATISNMARKIVIHARLTTKFY